MASDDTLIASDGTVLPMLRTVPLEEDGIHADVDYSDIEWYLYDTTEFNAWTDRLAEAQTVEEATAIYQWLLSEFNEIDTQSTVIWNYHYADVNNEELNNACTTADAIRDAAKDKFSAAVVKLLAGPLGEEMESVIGERTAEALGDYTEMSAREMELKARETELQLEYNQLVVRDDLSRPQINNRVGKVYLELIKVRNEFAKLRGYSSYAEYAYKEQYGRDFSPTEAAAFAEIVKPFAKAYYENCCYCSAFATDITGTGPVTAEDILATLREYAPLVSENAAAAEKYMEDHGLYLLESADKITDVGFTTSFYAYKAPFLYNSLYNNLLDMQVSTHEFGHYCEAYLHPVTEPLASEGSYDIFEIHSTGMEALFYSWYDEIFGDAADEARIYCLDGFFNSLVSGCIQDEFQRYVFDHPDMTVDDLDKCYYEIASSYGDPYADAYFWMDVSHNFENPFYYISYAVSALATLQIWELSQKNFEAAHTLYNQLVEYGAFDLGFNELLKTLNLVSLGGDMSSCIRTAYKSLENLCLSYDAANAA